jgi:hypothetical protein
MSSMSHSNCGWRDALQKELKLDKRWLEGGLCVAYCPIEAQTPEPYSYTDTDDPTTNGAKL